MPSVADLEAWRDQLLAMRAAGLRVVMYEGKRVEYQDDADLARALADIEARIARASSNRPHTVAFSARKGT
jgi:hypothetical protein